MYDIIILALQYLLKYDRLESIIETVSVMKIKEWSINIKLAMWNLENRSWETSVVLYGGMNIYRYVMKIQRCPWF